MTFRKLLKEWIIPFALEILIVLLLIKFVFFFIVVPTGSMIPTIDEHSYLFATRVYNAAETVKRGDILAFQSDELGQVLIKRCIGLPGDHVELDDEGKLYINGEYMEEPYVVNTSSMSGVFDVPEGCFLFLGDNRAESYDARMWNNPYISADKIQGKARFTIWPFSNFGVLK